MLKNTAKRFFKTLFNLSPPQYDFAIYSTNQYWGGSESTWLFVAKHFVNEKKKVVVFCQRGLEKELSKKAKPIDPKYFKIVYYKMNNSPLNLVWIYSLFLLNKAKVAYISHLHAMDGEFWMTRLHFVGTPYINFIPLCLSSAWPNDVFLKKMCTLFKDSKMLLFDSYRNLSYFDTLCGDTFQNKKKVLFNLLEPTAPALSAQKSHSSNDPIIFGIMARFDCNHKGYDILLSSLSLLQEKNWILHIAGNGPHHQLIKRLIDVFHLQKQVFFVNEPNPALFFENVDVAVFPSRFEGTPLVLLEAIHAQKVCVVTPVGGLDELILDEKTGFVSDHADSRSFAIALKKCLNLQDKWGEIRANSLNSLAQQLTELDVLKVLGKVLE